jgi:hypothetical protein
MSYILGVSKERKNQVLRGAKVGGLCALTWLFMALPEASQLILPAMFVSLFLAIKWRSLLPGVVILLSPLTIVFCLGMAYWFEKRPVFEYMGLPSSEAFNLDPKTRCYSVTGGCIVHGAEWVWQEPHNYGLRFMVAILGPPRGAYGGPYPTKEQAVQMTDTVAPASTDDFLQGTVAVDGHKFNLGRNLTGQMSDYFFLPFFTDYGSPQTESPTVRAAVYQNQCLLVRLDAKDEMSDNNPSKRLKAIVLIDLKTVKPFAVYVISGYTSQSPAFLADASRY